MHRCQVLAGSPQRPQCLVRLAPRSLKAYQGFPPVQTHASNLTTARQPVGPQLSRTPRNRPSAFRPVCYKDNDAPRVATQSKRLQCMVSGRVQGVGFRATAIRKASVLGLQGWVRNRHSGEVELLVEGSQERLQHYVVSHIVSFPCPAYSGRPPARVCYTYVKLFLEWLRQSPPGSRVTDVQSSWQDGTGEFKGMDVLYTA